MKWPDARCHSLRDHLPFALSVAARRRRSRSVAAARWRALRLWPLRGRRSGRSAGVLAGWPVGVQRGAAIRGSPATMQHTAVHVCVRGVGFFVVAASRFAAVSTSDQIRLAWVRWPCRNSKSFHNELMTKLLRGCGTTWGVLKLRAEKAAKKRYI